MATRVRKINLNGITKKTVKDYQLGAGVWFKNVSRTETYAQAKAAGKSLGATRGGGTFRAVATIMQVEMDGAYGRVKGSNIILGWEVSSQTTLIEVNKNTLKLALAAADIDDETLPGYNIITGRMFTEDEDFINICWMGCLAGTSEPIKIFIYNAFNENGLEFQTQDDGTGTIPLQLYAYNDLEELENDNVSAPFEIITKDTETPTTPSPTALGGDNAILLTWPAIEGATKYSVKSYAEGTYTVVDDDISTNWYTVTGLTADTEYTYLVQAYVGGAWSPAENVNYNVSARTSASE